MDYKIGKVSEFTTNKCHIINIKGRSIAIYRSKETFYAVRNRCPHKGAEICKGDFRGTMLPSNPNELNYGLEEQVVVCPWHGYEFDVKTGNALFNLTKLKLKTYDVYQKNGELYIKI